MNTLTPWITECRIDQWLLTNLFYLAFRGERRFPLLHDVWFQGYDNMPVLNIDIQHAAVDNLPGLATRSWNNVGNGVTKALAKRYSQLKPTRAKFQNQSLHRRVAKRYRKVQLACKKSFNCLNTTAYNNNKTTWRELAWVGWGGQTVENVARVGRKFELDQIQANSIQLKPSGWPNDTQLHRSCELGSNWLELGGPFGQGFFWPINVSRDKELSPEFLGSFFFQFDVLITGTTQMCLHSYDCIQDLVLIRKVYMQR